MSLLLDALNRASKEKQKAAAAALPPTVPTEPLQWEAVASTPEPVVAQSEPMWTPSPMPMPPTSPTPPQVIAPAVELELELELSPAEASRQIVQPSPITLTVAASEPAPIPTLVVPAPASSLSPSATSTVVPRSAPAPTTKAVSEGQMAQDIRRAYEKQPAASPGGRRRVLALGGLAVGLALAVGSVFLGLWGDPAKIMGLSGQSSVAMPPVVAAPGEVIVSSTSAVPVTADVAVEPRPAAVPTPSSAPMAAAKVASVSASAKSNESVLASAQRLVPAAGKTLNTPTQATATAPDLAPAPPANTTAPNNEVVLRANVPTKPAFVAKTRGPSALEQGYAALLDGRLDDAAQAYGQALRSNADERDALLGLAYINHQKGRREEAQAYYRKVLRQEPGNAIATAGLQSLDSGSDATLSASRASELAMRQPDSAAAMAMAGNAFVRDGLLADAAQAFGRAQALEPSNPLHAYNHAVALDRLGQHAAALAQYEKVLILSVTASAAVRAFQPEAVQLRVAQLRHALATTAPARP